MHFQNLNVVTSVHDDISIVKNKVHRAIGSDEHVADRIGIDRFQPNDEKNQDAPEGPQFGSDTRISPQIALFSVFRGILRTVFGAFLHSEHLSRTMFRPFGAGPPP